MLDDLTAPAAMRTPAHDITYKAEMNWIAGYRQHDLVARLMLRPLIMGTERKYATTNDGTLRCRVA